MLQAKEICTGELTLLITRKPIKHVYLRVCPVTMRVLISAPKRSSDAAILGVVEQKKSWIQGQLARLAGQAQRAKPAVLQFVSGETHPFLGGERPLTLVETPGPGTVALLADGSLEMLAPSGASADLRKRIFARWCRNQLLERLLALVAHWEKELGVQANEVRIRSMRTRWGSCNPIRKRIWFNLELIKKSPECIEYVVVHELAHLLERGHNARFWGIVAEHLPDWKRLRKELNASAINSR